MIADESPSPRPPVNQSAKAKLPISAYFMAVVSAIFVTFGVILAIAFSHLFVGEWVQSAPKWLLVAIPYIAIALGLMSGWQSLRQAKLKAIKKQAIGSGNHQVVCESCGEAVVAKGNVCPMCGGTLSRNTS